MVKTLPTAVIIVVIALSVKLVGAMDLNSEDIKPGHQMVKDPSKIGYGGGAVTIEGAGFSEDVFNQFDPVLGNKVTTILNLEL